MEKVMSLGFYNCLHTNWRPFIDLNRLNTFFKVAKLKSPVSIRATLTRGEWVPSIDLSDASLHISIHPSSRKFLRFIHQAVVYQFTSLPFGLATAPQVFTMIVKEVKLLALSRGIRLQQYLDNWFNRAPSQRERGFKMQRPL